jgi:hypothetical protein
VWREQGLQLRSATNVRDLTVPNGAAVSWWDGREFASPQLPNLVPYCGVWGLAELPCIAVSFHVQACSWSAFEVTIFSTKAVPHGGTWAE